MSERKKWVFSRSKNVENFGRASINEIRIVGKV